MIKYLGSKRTLVPVLGELFARSGAGTAVDLFTGTTRVAQEFARRGGFVHANDTAAYAHLLAQCYLESDPDQIDPAELADALAHLAALPDRRGYVTRVFCEQARYFQPHNGMRIDAIRAGIDEHYADHPLRPLLLTSLIEAADRVDSTVGLQMAYLKSWSARSHQPLRLRTPQPAPGTGRAWQLDAAEAVRRIPAVDLAYLDPPYNQHRYFTNYHVWETLVRGDEPEHYGIACKRVDSRGEETKSPWNSRRTMPAEFERVLAGLRAEVLVLSFSNEGFLPLETLVELGAAGGREVRVLQFDTRRHVGARIGIHNLAGVKVGRVSHTRNTEYLLVCGESARVDAMVNGLQPLAAAT
ncbi:DNA methyltransferase [Enemella dayhoffiae]|uniref:site-specific DNA-methyltransferase (adenine-specific) n=1 Tax=Enemella dayhoffiae TaxID=2016507 RepID=A0A255GQL8_9ACTN|nr:DNA adenine methylase [Enemella dayhoffiae]OYO18115.1 DNA methyltransferase [Enemella dayhoffiae]